MGSFLRFLCPHSECRIPQIYSIIVFFLIPYILSTPLCLFTLIFLIIFILLYLPSPSDAVLKVL